MNRVESKTRAVERKCSLLFVSSSWIWEGKRKGDLGNISPKPIKIMHKILFIPLFRILVGILFQKRLCSVRTAAAPSTGD
jgi:hypothetical protein